VDPAFYDELHALQERHWWYAARREILEGVLETVVHSGLPSGAVYDLGCGVGANLPVLKRFGPTVGVDSSPEAVAYCRERGHADVRLADLSRLEGLPDESASIVVLADVIEHLDDEDACLVAAKRLLKPGGALVVTVPAFMFLWSPADDAAHHKRRYVKSGLHATISRHFEISRLSYFNAFLFAPIAGGRLLEAIFRRSGHDMAHVPPSPLNTALRTIFAAEGHLLARFDIPFGVSLLCVARKAVTATT
jgi:SAM-dependent methyltransferase